MLLLAHIGFTMGVALACDRVLVYRQKHSLPASDSARTRTPQTSEHRQPGPDQVRALFDFRFWILGSILPDLIDKPAGHFLFLQVFHNNGRIFSHTLLFFLILLAAGLYLGISRKRMWLLALALGVFVHLVLDSMWRTPETLFWPLLGWGFPPADDYNWALSMLWEYFHDPLAFIPEIIGLLFIVWFIYKLIRNKRFGSFLRRGYY